MVVKAYVVRRRRSRDDWDEVEVVQLYAQRLRQIVALLYDTDGLVRDDVVVVIVITSDALEAHQ